MKNLIATLLFLIPVSANALLVEWEDVQYELSAVTGSFNELEDTLTQQIWWRSYSPMAFFLADMDLTGDPFGGFGGVNNVVLDNNEVALSPFFATQTNPAEGHIHYTGMNDSLWAGHGVIGSSFADPTWGTISADTEVTFMIATKVPEPSTFVLLGAGLIGLMLRKRSKQS